jgi:hypothetical protein
MQTFFAATPPAGRARRSRAVLLAALACFVAFQALFFVIAPWWPQLQDPEFGGLLVKLQARLAEAPPGQSFVLVLGSSHSRMGLRPDMLAATGPGGEPLPLVFNFSINNSGPLTSLVCLRRLLAEGVRPDWVIVEPCPLMLWLEGCRVQSHQTLTLDRVQWRDLPVLSRYYPDAHKFRVAWRAAQCLPWFCRRETLLSYLASRWVPPEQRLTVLWENTDRWGWQWHSNHLDPVFASRADVRQGVHDCFETFYQSFYVSDAAMNALGELAALCREHRIPMVILRMPEARDFQRWYPPPLAQRIDASLARVSREYQLPLFDARNWVPDTCFADGHHLTPVGAIAFTKEFERRILQPLTTGQPFDAADLDSCARERRMPVVAR